MEVRCVTGAHLTCKQKEATFNEIAEVKV